MTNNIQRISENLAKTEKFYATYKGWLSESDFYIDLKADVAQCNISNEGCAACGEFFGREGWIRELAYNEFNWTKDFDSVEIILMNVEKIEMNKTPVPAAAFPLELLDAANI